MQLDLEKDFFIYCLFICCFISIFILKHLLRTYIIYALGIFNKSYIRSIYVAAGFNTSLHVDKFKDSLLHHLSVFTLWHLLLPHLTINC